MTQPDSRTIVIIGGVAGGASAATRARRVNESARIILLEKDPHVSFANCGLPYYVGGEIVNRQSLLVATPELFAKRFQIDVRTRHEALEIDRARRVVRVLDRTTGKTYDQPYDRLILAPGAAPIVPSIPHTDAPNVFTLRNLEDTDRLKTCIDALPEGRRRAVVVGAGFIGLEMVEQLARRGFTVALAELQPQVLPPLDPEMARLVEEELTRNGVAFHLGDGLQALHVGLAVRASESGASPAGVPRPAEPRSSAAESAVPPAPVTEVELTSGLRLPADLVILGLGVRPNTKLAAAAGLALGPSGGIAVNATMQTSDPLIYAAGDAVEYAHGVLAHPARVPLAGPANRAGRLAGEHAATDRAPGAAPAMAPVFGTAIVRVFGLTAGSTGLSLKAAKAANLPATAVLIEARHHAGYFPGAQPMVLKLVYDPESGRVLGAQAVGAEGIDKRLDVIATTLHFGGTVEDLTGLDLAYAPPFGSAKDPVHMAGFAAANQRAGLVDYAQPDADLTGLQVLDVRALAEVAAAPLARLDGAARVVHIPVDELRQRLPELDPKLPTVVSCRSGLRAYIATRILRQHGFTDVRDLTGGALMRARA